MNGLSRLPLAGNRPTDAAGYRLPLNDQLSAKAVVCQAVPGSVVSSEAPHRPTGIAAAHLSAFNGQPCEYHSASPLPLSKTVPGFLSLNGPLLGKKKKVLSSK